MTEQLHLSAGTIWVYLSNIYKLGVHSRAKAMLLKTNWHGRRWMVHTSEMTRAYLQINGLL
ncbi:LuxR C-terminal-related transcriptional regulator [Paenibacillus taichungensis]|uniref:LuxR C-terminal-related transcriptional regulator n=1 Tax=Paenibacillus taichungensis TaxID=484184 RepID=UPI0039A0D93E